MAKPLTGWKRSATNNIRADENGRRQRDRIHGQESGALNVIEAFQARQGCRIQLYRGPSKTVRLAGTVSLRNARQRLSNRHRVKSAVHDEFGSGDETSRGVRRQQQRRADQFVRLAKPFHRSLHHDLRHAFWIQDLAVLFRREKARHEDVHAHAGCGPLACEILGNVVDRRLRRRG